MKEKKRYVKPEVIRVRLDMTQATLGTNCWSTLNPDFEGASDCSGAGALCLN